MRAAVLAAAAVIAGCGGAGPATPASVASHAPVVTGDVLLKDLPGGNLALIGGNYARLERQLQGFFSRMVSDVSGDQATGDDFGRWITCFRGLDGQHYYAALAQRDGSYELRTVTSGLTMARLARCAQQAGYHFELDPDGKYFSVELRVAGHTRNLGYLLLDDGAVYLRMPVQLRPDGFHVSRADLEADRAAARARSAAQDTALLALAKTVDRSRTGWFVGNFDGTPAGSVIQVVSGTIDVDHGFALDLTADLASEPLAARIEDGVAKAKAQALQLPPALRDVMNGIAVQRDGRRIHATIRLSFDQMSAMIDAIAPRHRPAPSMAQQIAQLGQFRNEMCACQDAACAQQVSEQMTRWSQQAAPAKPTDDEARQMAEIARQLTDCMTRAMGATQPAGSASP